MWSRAKGTTILAKDRKEKDLEVPVLDDLGDLRKAITSDGRISQDNWRKAEKGDGPDAVPKEWTGSCICRVRWSATSEACRTGSLPAVSVGQVDRAVDPP